MLASLPESVRARICYAGFQPPDALPQFFAQADVFVLPSRYDGWGVVVNQALGAGLPIIASDQVGAAFELIRASENGFIFPAGDTNALAAAMRQYTTTPALAEAHAAASRRLRDEWTPAHGAERWAQALQTICV
jgi:glycosyltransferase involved in cell wall biosynthesis